MRTVSDLKQIQVCYILLFQLQLQNKTKVDFCFRLDPISIRMIRGKKSVRFIIYYLNVYFNFSPYYNRERES
jgi:hypothetical protein